MSYNDRLRALLGDRYVPTIQAAVLADNPDAITSAQRVGGKLGQLMYLAAVDRLDRVLAGVLPGLLAAAWDDGDALAAELAHMREARDNARAEVERLTAQIEAAKRIGLGTHLGRPWASVLNDVLRALDTAPGTGGET